MQILRSQCTAVTQEWQSMGKENLELEKTNKMMKQELDKVCRALYLHFICKALELSSEL